MKALLRIVIAVIIAVLIGVALIRQPILRATPYDAIVRSDPRALQTHVEYLVTQFRPRDADHPEQLARAAAYIERTFLDAGGGVEVQDFDARKKHYRNVSVTFGPATGPLLIVGAHYDAFSMSEPLPGADDNASGVAALLELARMLGKEAPKHRVMLVAFANEEPPFFGSDEMGSAVHAASLVQSKTNVEGMIALDMIGFFAAEQPKRNAMLAMLYPTRGDFVAVAGGWRDRKLTRRVKAGIAGAGEIGVVSFTGPRAASDASDHRNYWSANWPAVLVSDTAYLRNPHYHTRNDTPDTLDYNKMARVVDGLFNAIRN